MSGAGGLEVGRRRTLSSVSWVAACLLVVVTAACSRQDAMVGTVLSSSEPAAPFELRDQFGEPAALADYSGQVVVLTFLYTYCPDICPAATHRLRQTHELLGDDDDRVEFVAISVDPARDTVERAHAYSQDWGMLERWAFLTGDEQELSPIWEAYYVDPTIDRESEAGAGTAQVNGSPKGAADSLRRAVQARYEISHSAPVYLIDRQGLMRVLFTPPLEPDDIAHDIRVLLD